MNPLLYSSIQSAAYGNHFECSTADAEITDAVFSSMSHLNEVGVIDEGEALLLVSLLNNEGLKAAFPQLATEDGLLIRHPKNDLTDHLALLGRIFQTAATLPPDSSAILPEITERQQVVKSRLGQHRYKVEQASLWDNACAVTGISEPALLRASHAKPWCDSNDAERLDPTNGLTLVVHLDALFDAGLISFDDNGAMLISPRLGKDVISYYNLSSTIHLKKSLSEKQRQYLNYHRLNVFVKE